jgi:hypothetical protein
MQAVADEHDTAERDATVLALGRGTESIDHVFPSHVSARGASLLETHQSPTAMQYVLVGHDTPLSRVAVAVLGIGTSTSVQVEPVNDSVRGASIPALSVASPTAMHELFAGQEMAASAPNCPKSGIGARLSDHPLAALALPPSIADVVTASKSVETKTRRALLMIIIGESPQHFLHEALPQ